MQKVAIVGPESSGKTTLCEALAAHYAAPWVEEYAREHLTQRNGVYVEQDLCTIASLQHDIGLMRVSDGWRRHAAVYATMRPEYDPFQKGAGMQPVMRIPEMPLVLFDTDMITIMIWSLEKFGRVHPQIEQFVRDARIAQIYEGTNAIQALDLVGRKLPMEGGRLVRRFFELVKGDIERLSADSSLAELGKPVGEALYRLQKATMSLAERAFANPDEAGAAATDYLTLMGYTAVGWQWLLMADDAQRKLAAGEGDRAFLEAKLKTARYYMSRVIPDTAALLTVIQSGSAPIMAFDASEF